MKTRTPCFLGPRLRILVFWVLVFWVRRSHQPGQLFREGSTTVNYTFSNTSGDEAVCVFDIIVYAGENAGMALSRVISNG